MERKYTVSGSTKVSKESQKARKATGQQRKLSPLLPRFSFKTPSETKRRHQSCLASRLCRSAGQCELCLVGAPLFAPPLCCFKTPSETGRRQQSCPVIRHCRLTGQSALRLVGALQKIFPFSTPLRPSLAVLRPQIDQTKAPTPPPASLLLAQQTGRAVYQRTSSSRGAALPFHSRKPQRPTQSASQQANERTSKRTRTTQRTNQPAKFWPGVSCILAVTTAKPAPPNAATDDAKGGS